MRDDASHDARPIDGWLLDAFTEPPEVVDDRPEDECTARERELLRIRGWKVMLERDGFGTWLRAGIERIDRKGPPASLAPP